MLLFLLTLLKKNNIELDADDIKELEKEYDKLYDIEEMKALKKFIDEQHNLLDESDSKFKDLNRYR